jgi:hypothetical protein
MKTFVLAAILCVLAGSVYAQSPTCKAQAEEKKLHGASHDSFMTKCEKDAKADCDKQATDKKYAGAAKTSFTTKCVKDAVGQ